MKLFKKRQMVTLVTIIATTFALSFWMVANSREITSVANISRDLRYKLSLYNSLLSDLSDAQVGVRGYVIVKDLSLLDSFWVKTEEAKETIQILKTVNFAVSKQIIKNSTFQIENFETILKKVNIDKITVSDIKEEDAIDRELQLIFEKEIVTTEKQLKTNTSGNRYRLSQQYWVQLLLIFLLSILLFLFIKIYLAQEKDKIAFQFAAADYKLESETTKQRTYEMVAHELRVPLQIIVGYSGLLRLSNISIERQESAHEKIDNAIARINNIVDTMLFLASDLEPEFTIQDITIVCKTAIEQVKGIMDCPMIIEEIPSYPVYLNINEPIFTSFLYNMLSNAIKYSPQNKPVTVAVDQTGEEVIVRISDRGIGIPECELKQLFNPFFRASNSKGIKGSGLGLVVAKKSVEIHKGELSVHSKEGVGTTFTAWFPTKQH